MIRAELQGIGDFYWNDSNTLKQEAYELVNLRTGLETDNYSLTLWVKNLFDKNYNCVAFAFAGSSVRKANRDQILALLEANFEN